MLCEKRPGITVKMSHFHIDIAPKFRSMIHPFACPLRPRVRVATRAINEPETLSEA